MRIFFLAIWLCLPIRLCFSYNSLELRGAADVLANHSAREIYSTVVPSLEVEAAHKFSQHVAFWSNVAVTWKEGRSHPLGEKTDMTLTTLSVGPKGIWSLDCCCLEYYLGAGVTGAWLQLNNQSPYVPAKTVKWSLGGVVKMGILQLLSARVYLNYFLDYYYQPFFDAGSVTLQGRHVDLGGLHAGVGIGMAF